MGRAQLAAAGRPDFLRDAGRKLDRPGCGICRRPLDPWGGCKRRDCAGYFPTWAGDYARVIRDNVRELGRCDCITVTAPGADELPWATWLCKHEPTVACSGPLGCVVAPGALARWHADFWLRWGKLWRAARASVRRAGLRPPEYWLGPEPQKRGALHVHVATAVTDRVSGHELYRQLCRLAPRYGFGSVSWDPARGSGADAPGLGAYIAKIGRYLADPAKRPELLRVLEVSKGRRLSRGSNTLTARTRSTMRNARAVRFFYHQGGRHPALTPKPPVAEKMMRMWRVRQAWIDAGHAPPSTYLDVLLVSGHTLPSPASA